MKKLVELDAAVSALDDLPMDYGRWDVEDVLYALASVPTVDAAPVRHGHWVRWYEAVCDSFGVGYAPHYKCSECDTEYDQYDAMRMNYCPNCGAKFIEDIDGKRRAG